MAKRRGRNGNGAGMIRPRGDGRWEVRITLPDGMGKKSYYAKTQAEARAKLTATLHALDTGAPLIKDERLTVERYLTDWLERKRADVRPNTWRRYSEFTVHVTRALGDTPLVKLTPARLERLYADLMGQKASGGAGLSSTTVHHIHTMLSQALADAERLGLVARNVAQRRSGAHPPRIRQIEMPSLDLEQARVLLQAARDEPFARLEALYVLAITTGMRQGELLALRWRDVDLTSPEAGALQVRGTLSQIKGTGFHIGPPKTPQSRRRVDLTAEAIAALRRHKARQAEERLAVGAAWGDVRWPDLVFTNEVGRPLDGRNLRQRAFAQLLRHAGLPAIRFHDLRHTAVTLMLQQGTPAKVVSERVGHASSSFTQMRYGHVLPGMQREAAEKLAKALFG